MAVHVSAVQRGAIFSKVKTAEGSGGGRPLCSALGSRLQLGSPPPHPPRAGCPGVGRSRAGSASVEGARDSGEGRGRTGLRVASGATGRRVVPVGQVGTMDSV